MGRDGDARFAGFANAILLIFALGERVLGRNFALVGATLLFADRAGGRHNEMAFSGREVNDSLDFILLSVYIKSDSVIFHVALLFMLLLNFGWCCCSQLAWRGLSWRLTSVRNRQIVTRFACETKFMELSGKVEKFMYSASNFLPVHRLPLVFISISY